MSRHYGLAGGALSALLLLLGALSLIGIVTKASALDTSACSKYKIIYARGSSQAPGASTELISLKNNLAEYGIPFDSVVELDASNPVFANSLGLTYPAVAVLNSSGASAVLTRGTFGKYVNSANSGRELLINYIQNSNFLECGTRLVFTGYSQGGQVITDTLADSRMVNYLPQISFVATFGDPSLDLNTILGGNVFSSTPWYRGNAAKYISGGLVKVRNPYVPDQLTNKTGAWCLADDMICTGNLFQALNELAYMPHTSQYPLRAIPSAAREIAARLKEDLTQPFTGPACGAIKQDIVIALNVSPSVMADDQFWSESGQKKISDAIKAAGCDVRVGMVTFGRRGKELTQPIYDLGSMTTSVALPARGAERSFTVEKADVQGGISLALDMSWREDAQKSIIVFSDTPGDNYKDDRYEFINYDDLMARPEMQAILQKSREKGGVEIHAAEIMHPNWLSFPTTFGGASFYRYMSKLVPLTAGTYANRNSCNSCSWQNMTLSYKDMFAQKPTVSIPNIRVKKGQSVTLTARDVSGGVIKTANARSNGVLYSWYLNCGRLDELTNSTKSTTYTFTPTKTGTCQGAVLAKEDPKSYCSSCFENNLIGVRAVTSFQLEVLPADYIPPPLPSLVRNIKKEHIWDEDILRITWDPPANAAAVGEMVYVVRDGDGTVLGVTKTPQIDITDVPDDSEPIVLVSAASEGGNGQSLGIATAEDISGPKPEAGGVLGESTGNDWPSKPRDEAFMPSGITQQVLSSAVLVADATPSVTFKQISVPAQPPVLFSGSGLENVANVISQGAVHQMSRVMNAPTWLKLTITAVPIAVAIGLGLSLKYTLKLRSKQF